MNTLNTLGKVFIIAFTSSMVGAGIYMLIRFVAEGNLDLNDKTLFKIIRISAFVGFVLSIIILG